MLEHQIVLEEKTKLFNSLEADHIKLSEENWPTYLMLKEIKDIEVDCYLNKQEKCVQEIVNLRMEFSKHKRKQTRELNSYHTTCFFNYIPLHMREAEREPVRTREDLECYRRFIECKHEANGKHLQVLKEDREVVSNMLNPLKEKYRSS